MIAYGRFDQKDKCLIVLNNEDEDRTISVPVWKIGMKLETDLENCLLTDREGFTDDAFHCPVKDGFVELTMPSKSAVVLKEVD